MLIRLIFLLLGVYFVFRVFSRVIGVIGAKRETRRETDTSVTAVLHSCSVCGTYCQRNQGVEKGGRFFCSERCATSER